MEKLRVLIVEDENIIAEDLRNSLESLNYTVCSVVPSGEEALDLVSRVPIDIVLMDIVLRGTLDGVEAANRLRENHDVPVVFLTSHADERTFERAKISEPYGYITKPFRLQELQIAIEMAVYKHRSEGELRRIRQWLSTILNSIADGVVATDGAGKIAFMNPIAEQLVGKKQDACLGESLENTFRLLKETDGTTLFSEDGRKTPIDVKISPIKDEKGFGTGQVWVFRDVTERKKAEVHLRGQLRVAEVKYRTLVEQIPAVTYIAIAGSIAYVSPQLEKMFGFTQEEWLADPDLMTKQLHPDDAKQIVDYRSKAFEDARPFRAEYRIIAKNGTIVWVLDDATTVKDDRGRPLFTQGVLLDITEQKHAEMQLKSSHQQLRALSRRLQTIRKEERTRIAREIHDDLGQALTALRMNLTLLNKKLLSSSTAPPRRTLLTEMSSLSDIVGLAIQRVQQIATELRPEILDHLGLRSAMEWQLQDFQSRTGITCTYETDFDSLELPLDAATAIFRIFQETLTNVARHANASSVDVRLSLSENQLLMQIRDNGVGISQAALSDPKSLGLLGMRERALILGGEFQVSGDHGQGTVVQVRIPRQSLGLS